jgi:hypothetical protein
MPINILQSGMFFSVILLISAIFLGREIAESCWAVRTGQNGPFERECRLFQLFFIDFQLFYFLTRIIPVQYIYMYQV